MDAVYENKYNRGDLLFLSKGILNKKKQILELSNKADELLDEIYLILNDFITLQQYADGIVTELDSKDNKQYITTDGDKIFYEENPSTKDRSILGKINMEKPIKTAGTILQLYKNGYDSKLLDIDNYLPATDKRHYIKRDFIIFAILLLHDMYKIDSDFYEEVIEHLVVEEKEDLGLDEEFVEWLGY